MNLRTFSLVFAACPAFLPAAGLAQAIAPIGTVPAAAAPATTTAPAPIDEVFSAADIEAATFTGQDLPSGRSALTAKVQIMLDRSGTSPGVVDGFKGGMSESAIMAFERRARLPMDGRLDQQVWDLLLPYAASPVTQDYTITEADAQGLVDSIPVDYAEKAQMEELGYTSIAEKLGERFHMDEKFIGVLNPGVTLAPGVTIKVMAPSAPLKGEVARIIVDKATRRVAGYSADGEMLVDYPATIGSDATPSPTGDHVVVTTAFNPNYTYNPNVNFKQGENDKVLTIPPGPNGPVGSVWIDLSKPTYGIHGTPTPSQLFRNQSNGCVRLTNWDAQELAKMVKPGVTRVEFLNPGVTIADVTGYAPSAATAAAETGVPADDGTLADATLNTPSLPDPGAVTAVPLPGNITPLPADGGEGTPNPGVVPLPDQTVGPAGNVIEDTTEIDTDPADLTNDPLLDALNNALRNLPDGSVPEAQY
ncbi:L,D-transpeptidase (plasmid) [Paracoccus sp. TK19116]|uniref:L,D-transpeptidase n=1 Tax=Paracoccus albicereus TaxID=2922394 RepID=A0ABT1MLC9_9RHOB|nr:L,D-transpeptidase [Paracoccus albicereus]MCQ0969105.1 L,D-transpeptidase [Paracoccus albicereus]